VLQSARQDPEQQAALTKVAQEADQDLIGPLFQYSNEGIPLAHGWATLQNAARFGTDYVSCTAAAKANIFANKPEESTYFFTWTRTGHSPSLSSSNRPRARNGRTGCRHQAPSSRCSCAPTGPRPPSPTATGHPHP
jgi:hypothetical protein